MKIIFNALFIYPYFINVSKLKCIECITFLFIKGGRVVIIEKIKYPENFQHILLCGNPCTLKHKKPRRWNGRVIPG
jgi:hypothetical protein